MSDFATAGATLYTATLDPLDHRIVHVNGSPSAVAPVPLVWERIAVSPSGQIALCAHSNAARAYGCLFGQAWVDLGPSNRITAVAWINGQAVFAYVGPGGGTLVEVTIVAGTPQVYKTTTGGFYPGLHYYDPGWGRFVALSSTPTLIGPYTLYRPMRVWVEGRWIYCGQRVGTPDHLFVTDGAGVAFVAGRQPELPTIAAIGTTLYTNGPTQFPAPYPTLTPTPTPPTPEPPDPPEPPTPHPPIPPVPPMQTMTLLAHTQRYVCAELDATLMANRAAAQSWETFQFHPVGDRVVVKTAHGRFVTAEPDGRLVCDRPYQTPQECGVWERFRLTPGEGGGHALQTHHGTWWTVDAEGDGRVYHKPRPVAHPGRYETFNRASPTPLPPSGGRSGIPKGQGFSLVDDSGSWLAWGTSLFWAPYGALYEPARIDDHLSYIRGKGADYIRAIPIGLRKGTLERSLDPRQPEYQRGIEALFQMARRSGLRVQWSLFGATYSAPTKTDRAKAVDAFCEVAKSYPAETLYVEVANEGWTNGFAGDVGRDELVDLASRVRARLPNLVATTCPKVHSAEGQASDDLERIEIEYYYKSTLATIRGDHYARKLAPPDGIWRPTKKPWRERLFAVPGCCALCVNQEPRGPESSGSETNDPLVLTTDAAVSWLSGNAAYTLHTGAGIYGVADPSRNRPADLWDTQNIDLIMQGIETTRRLLPADLPNFTKHSTDGAAAPFTFVDVPEEQFSAAYSATSGSGPGQRIVIVPYGIVRATPFTLRTGSCQGVVYDPVSGQPLETFTKTFRTAPPQPAVVVVATRLT